jgi:hypothetical protein
MGHHYNLLDQSGHSEFELLVFFGFLFWHGCGFVSAVPNFCFSSTVSVLVSLCLILGVVSIVTQLVALFLVCWRH